MDPQTTTPIPPHSHPQPLEWQPQPKGEGTIPDSVITPATINANSGTKILLSNNEVPVWYSEPQVLTGYRPVNSSVRLCLQSLSYLHNETVNIFSHLIPALVALVLIGLVPLFFRSRFPNSGWQDRLIFQIYLATSAVCFAVSALYHLLLCHSQRCHDLWVRLDYAAILFQILGSFVSGIYLGFYCEPNLQTAYWSMVGDATLL